MTDVVALLDELMCKATLEVAAYDGVDAELAIEAGRRLGMYKFLLNHIQSNNPPWLRRGSFNESPPLSSEDIGPSAEKAV